MDYQLQVVTLSVRDVDKAAAFYTEQAGFTLDVDYRPASGFRVAQLTPPGSACSVQFGTALTDAPPGSARATYLAVTDIEAAHRELTERGVPVSVIRHKSPADDWRGGWAPGPDPDRRDYASLADFTDPDGNTWVIQEIGYRPPGTKRNDRPAGHHGRRDGPGHGSHVDTRPGASPLRAFLRTGSACPRQVGGTEQQEYRQEEYGCLNLMWPWCWRTAAGLMDRAGAR